MKRPQRDYSLHAVYNGLRWLVRAGTSWWMLPTTYHPGTLCSNKLSAGSKLGFFEELVQDLRRLLRLARGREAAPPAIIFEGRPLQSTPESGGRAGYGRHNRR